jgi:preprotein translocase SecE subunit
VAKAEVKKTAQNSFNPVSKGIEFVDQSWAELKKVQMPTRQETMLMTVLVLVLLFLSGFFLGVVDLLCGWLMQKIL